jgi:hypothetical protein
MTMDTVRRRRIDRIVAAVIAVAVVAVAVIIYLRSDARATSSVVGPTVPAPPSPETVPTLLTESWSLPTDPELGAVASPYGVVITATDTAVTGHDAVTGDVRWSYGRSDSPLCAVGSGDTDAPGVNRRGRVRGVTLVSAEHDFCSQVMLLDPNTGERHYYRTSPNQPGGGLAFGGPYAAWMGPTLVELWRDDLVRTIQYGDQPTPPKPTNPQPDCTFTDIALADEQFATVEHCPELGPNAQVVINWATPDSAPDKPEGQDVFKHDPRARIDTGSPAARLVGITADRVAVLVAEPEPAVVVYDAAGTETSRTPVAVPADRIVAADNPAATPVRITPSVRNGDARYSLIGDHLVAVGARDVDAPAPTSSSAITPAGETEDRDAVPPSAANGGQTGSGTSAGLPTDATDATTTTAPAPATVQVKDPQLLWAAPGVLGLPAVTGERLLLTVPDGLVDVAAANGNPGIVPAIIPVDRGGYRGRVDAAAVGSMIIETRRDTVVALAR